MHLHPKSETRSTRQPKKHPQSKSCEQPARLSACIKTQNCPRPPPPKRGDGRHTDGPEGVSALPPLFPRGLEKGTILQTGLPMSGRPRYEAVDPKLHQGFRVEGTGPILEASQDKPGCLMMMRLREDPVVVQAFVRNTPVEKLQLHTGRSWAFNYSSGTGQKGSPSTFFNHPRRGTFDVSCRCGGCNKEPC